MVTEVLARAGLWIGDELIDADQTNPYGHFEDREVMTLHERMLADAGHTWHVAESFTPVISKRRWVEMTRIVDHRQARYPLWGFKDPRVCFYLAAWKHLVPAMKVLAVYRDPRECADSLERRHARELLDGTGPAELHRLFWQRPDHALRMWVQYNAALLDFARAHRDDTLVVPHAAVADGLPLVDAVNHVLGTGLQPVSTYEVFDPAAVGAKPGRRAVGRSQTVQDVLETWNGLEMLAADDADRFEEVTHARP